MAKLENVAKQVSLFTETDINITSALFFYQYIVGNLRFKDKNLISDSKIKLLDKS